MADAWDAVLDDLEARVAAAEAGDLSRLEGWTAPAVRPGPGSDLARAVALAGRQQALMAHLTQERARVSASLGALRRRAKLKALGSAPVYLDRLA